MTDNVSDLRPGLKDAIQTHRNEAYQNGWNDGYAEGYGKTQADYSACASANSEQDGAQAGGVDLAQAFASAVDRIAGLVGDNHDAMLVSGAVRILLADVAKASEAARLELVRERARWEAVAETAWAHIDKEATKAIYSVIGQQAELPAHMSFYNALEAAEARALAAETALSAREVATDAAATITAQAQEIEGLKEALKPFAEAADAYDPDDGDEQDVAWSHDFTIASLRRARAAIRKETT